MNRYILIILIEIRQAPNGYMGISVVKTRLLGRLEGLSS
jgi:hypothetical protein